ncbi:MAG: hypothetical protein EP341_00200 [Sphingomonadales bacterium]|nr:MAG: hypothetical protein EP341_00200 [Sphingomonadales bacterium]
MIRLLFLYGILALIQVSVAAAGELRAVPDTLGCDYLFTGTVDVGDAKRIEAAIRPSADGVTLCLDSPGGSYLEGIRMFYAIWHKDSIETRVLKGSSCFSACALAFQGGSRVVGSGAIRAKFASIEPGGRLGFHAPTLSLPNDNQYSPETVKAAYDEAIWGASQLFTMSRMEEHAVRGMSDFLYAHTLATPPESIFEIDTIGKASLAEVGVRNVPMPEITWRGIRNVCETAIVMTDGHLSRNAELAGAFRAFSHTGDDGTGRPIALNDRVWSWSTEFQSNFVVRGYPAPHVNERFCKVSVSRFALERELSLPSDQRDVASQWFTVTLWNDAYVPNDSSFSQYAQANIKIDETASVPWTALWDPMTPLSDFMR